jgi:hypothetical protein
MLTDRRHLADARFRTLLLKWLAELPADGWEGTSHDLGEMLAAFAERHRLIAFVPTCPGRKVADLSAFLTDNEYTLTNRRTKQERTLRITRVVVGVLQAG